MPQLHQSTRLSVSPSALQELLLRAPQIAVASNAPAIFWFAPNGFAPGSLLEYRLLSGIRRVAWNARIVGNANGKIRTELERGPLHGFSAQHQLESDGSGCIMRDSLVFAFERFSCDALLEQADLIWHLDQRMAADGETGSFFAIATA